MNFVSRANATSVVSFYRYTDYMELTALGYPYAGRVALRNPRDSDFNLIIIHFAYQASEIRFFEPRRETADLVESSTIDFF